MPSERDLPDEQLVARARRGDREAFAVLVARYQRPLTGRALASTRKLEDADDAVQETFFRAWQGLPRFREDARFGPWLFRILDNHLADRGRRRGREVPGAEQFAEVLADPAPGADERLVADELATAVRGALDRLPPGRQREVFQLRYEEGLPVNEIAQRLGLHSGTVKVHLFRGARELRRLLGGAVEGTR
ncbi:MAG: RNA polymerase sigma factor [Acidobacteria bacterium]|nr:RNA polymerase sigma factor [Acidobacteriota bacterium]